MAANSVSSSSDDRRNISSLLNPSEKMNHSNSSPLPVHTQSNSHQQPSPQGQQHIGVHIMSSYSATYQPHPFPPLLPDHQLQAILVQTTPGSDLFRLSRASWDGDGPPPESFEGSGLPGGTEVTPDDSSTPGAKQARKVKGKVARAKEAAVTVPPSQFQYPTEQYVPPNSSHCTQPSVGLGEAVATPIPLGPPQVPPASVSKLKWTQTKQQANDSAAPIPSEPAAPQLQSADRVSIRLAARDSFSNTSPLPSTSASPHVSPSQPGPQGQPFEQQSNSNGKRALQDDGGGVKGRGRKKKRSGAGPADAPSQPHDGMDMPAHMPMQMAVNGGGTHEIPLDPTFFTGAGPSGGGGTYSHYPPPANHPFESSQQVGLSNPLNYTIGTIPPPDKLSPELQFARCMSNRYKPDPFPRCVSCTRRWAGDTCRFQGIRFLLRDAGRRVLGVSFVDNQSAESPNMKFPNSWNIPLEPAHVRRVKCTVTKALLPTLKAEQDHLRLPEVIRRPRETEVRATCDTCMTSIFACSWMCRICGREACEDCFKQVRELTHPIRAVTAAGEKKQHPNPFFLSCTKRQEHAFRDFSPVSRFCFDELAAVVREMEQLIRDEDDRVVGHVTEDESDAWEGRDHAEATSNMPGSIMTTTVTSSMRTSPGYSASQMSLDPSLDSHGPECPKSPGSDAEKVAPPPPPPQAYMPEASVPLPPPVAARYGDPLDPAQVPSHPYYVFEHMVPDAQFQSLWALGEVVVVTGLLNAFAISWTPEHFIRNFEESKCLILECHSDENKSINVGEFFSQFGMYVGRTKCWKLKDWPPSSDFKTTFPDLYEDFSRAVPVPNYTRRDGALNIASHFPANTIAPDIGPKMYNAFASSEMPGAKGSTRLHMDMADAVNIMVYSATRPDGGDGMAAWDIFRSQDTPKIRSFLRKRFKGQFTNDPIHSQLFYLDVRLRRQLFDEFGVSSWRLYQRPGDAVFIPAGCAHQVVNLSDCIKVACDFVSPENIDRCSALTREFREQNQTQTWKEDVLQLSAMLWYCWLNLCRVEKDLASQERG